MVLDISAILEGGGVVAVEVNKSERLLISVSSPFRECSFNNVMEALVKLTEGIKSATKLFKVNTLYIYSILQHLEHIFIFDAIYILY